MALKIQAVGFRVKRGRAQAAPVHRRRGGGRYVDADNAQELGGQLRSLTARALRPYVTQGKALEGVPAPAEAKLYGPGQYTTSVSASSPSWYSFKVGAGQSIAISATLPDSEAGIPSVFKTELQDESLEFADSDAATNGDDVLTAVVKDDVGEEDLRKPPVGRLFYKLEVDPAPGQSGPYPDRAVRAGDRQGDRARRDCIGRLGGRSTRAPTTTTGRATACWRWARWAASWRGCWRGGALAGARRRRPA